MLTLFKNKWFLLLTNILLSFILYWVLAPQYNLHYYINALFYVGLIYLIFWLISFIIRGRFLDGFVYGFKRISERIMKDEFLDERPNKANLAEKISTRFLNLILFQVLSLISLMVVLLVLYYMLIV